MRMRPVRLGPDSDRRCAARGEESIEYFEQLDAATDRLELREVGRSSFGRPVYIALISSAEDLRNLDRHREVAHAQHTIQLAYDLVTVAPLMWRTVNLIGMSMSQALEERGQAVAAAAPANPDFWEAPEEEEDESMTEGGR